MRRSHLPPAEVRAIIDAQMPLAEKIARADHVVWNNGPLTQLKRQGELLAQVWRGR